MAKVEWEGIAHNLAYSNATQLFALVRSKIPGGWLVAFYGHNIGGLTFVPDPNHKWDGNSLP